MPRDVVSELGAQRAAGDREGDLDVRPPAFEADRAHHAEADEVLSELGIDDAGQRGEQLVVRRPVPRFATGGHLTNVNEE